MTGNTRKYVVCVILLIVCIMLTLIIAHHNNRTRNIEQIDNYINELSQNTAKHVADVFADKLDSIDSIAYLYGKSIKSTDADLELLGALEDKSGFDRIRFIASDGTDYTSDGSTTSVKDRNYFIRGMRGESGICEVLESRINGEKLIGFYAPVYFDEKICGITVGFLRESTVSNILDTNLYDYPADTYIFNEDGYVLGRYMGQGTFEISDMDEGLEYVSKECKESVADAISEHKRCQFTYTGAMDQSVGYIMPIDGTTWTLAQVFPSEATNIIVTTTNSDSVTIFILSTIIFAAFITLVIIIYRKSEKVRSEELAYNKVSLLMRSLSDDYLFIVDVDLETQQEIKYIVDSGAELEELTYGVNNDYVYCVKEFADLYITEYDRQRFLEATELPALRDVLANQNDFYIEYDAVINGENRLLQSKFTISDFKQFENHMLISIRDITEMTKERKVREKELSEARIMAESSNKAKTAFLFNMSHDIRTPINAIMGYTNLLEQHIDEKEKLLRYIEKIKYSSDFLLSLINNVLEMARIESGKTVLSETVCDIKELNETISAVFEEQFNLKKLNFIKEINIKHTAIYCDTLKLKQIYLNLLSNAVKYTPESGIIKMTMDELPYEKEGYGLFRCAVSDTGIGMSEEFVGHVFEEFERESNATESKTAGSGLGMTIVRKLVELMGGNINVKSRLGEGTTFVLTIPHRLADECELEKGDSFKYSDKDVEFSNKRILIAEDNDMNAEIAEEILGAVGFETERAEDGAVCVQMLQDAPEGYYDLILMDIQMPNMNGYEASRAIRKLDGKISQIPIIAMTANAFEEDRKNAFEAQMDEHIAKPIEIRKLMATLAEVLRTKR